MLFSNANAITRLLCYFPRWCLGIATALERADIYQGKDCALVRRGGQEGVAGGLDRYGPIPPEAFFQRCEFTF